MVSYDDNIIYEIMLYFVIIGELFCSFFFVIDELCPIFSSLFFCTLSHGNIYRVFQGSLHNLDLE